MLYKFKSQAAADVVMLEATGRQVLQIIDKHPAVPGIITTKQMPAALQALRQAIALDEAVRGATSGDRTDDFQTGEPDTLVQGDSVSLRQRLWPFVALLERSFLEQKNVIW